MWIKPFLLERGGGKFGNHFGKYLKPLFELYEFYYHRNVIIIRTNKAGEYHNLSLYCRGRRKRYLIKYSHNIMIYHYITGGKRYSYLVNYSDNIMIYHFIKSILKLLVILVIWLALRGAIYSRIAPFLL